MEKTENKHIEQKIYLTRMESRVYDFIKNFTTLYHYSPTLREIAVGCETSKSYAWAVVQRLRDMDMLDYKPKTIRTIVIK